MKTSKERVEIIHKGKRVQAVKLTVASTLELNTETAWQQVKTSALLEFVCKGMITFLPHNKPFPTNWKEKTSVQTRMLMFSVLPSTVHTIYFDVIDDTNKTLKTLESNIFAKIWNHTIYLQPTADSKTIYTDEVIIYGGMFTRAIARFTQKLYEHRQKRWRLLVSLG